MSDIIAGSPAPTNPTERAELLVMLLHGGAMSPKTAAYRIDRFAAEVRAEVLAEALDAARSQQRPRSGWDSEELAAYNAGVAAAMTAISHLAEKAAQGSVDAQFPIVAAFLAEGGDQR